MLNISTWTLDPKPPRSVRDLPDAFLQRLWLLSAEARSSCCSPKREDASDATESAEELGNGVAANHGAVNPLDLVTAVFLSANAFLQQEMVVRMLRCHFAVPLVIPNIEQDEPSHFLLWPQRGAASSCMSPFPERHLKICEGNLASTNMLMVSCVKLGYCDVSKSQVLNKVIRSTGETFLHRGVGGGELPRRLSNGLVEISWCLPTGDAATDTFRVPVVLSNLRGDAGLHEKCLSLLCQASSAVVVFCGDLKEEQTQLIASCKDKASNVIIIDLSDDHTVTGAFDQSTDKVIRRGDLSEEELADRLRQTLRELLPGKVKAVTLEAVAKLAEELAFRVDEAAVCKKAMATAQEVLEGLDEGSTQFKEKQLPLQVRLWSKWAEIERKEQKQTKEGKETDPLLLQQKEEILAELNGYKMTPAMKTFSRALFTADKTERSFFLHWMRLQLEKIQAEKQMFPAETSGGVNGNKEVTNGGHFDLDDSDSFCTDSSTEDETEEQLRKSELQVPERPAGTDPQVSSAADEEFTSQQEKDSTFLVEELRASSDGPERNGQDGPDDKEDRRRQISDPQEEERKGQHVEEQEMDSDSPVQQVSAQLWTSGSSPLSLQHFLCEMGLIFELACVGPGAKSKDVSRLPGVAAQLLLYGLPLSLMDGDSSTVPVRWLGCVFAELKRCLPQEHCSLRVLTSLGVRGARNAEVLSSLFAVTFPGGGTTKGVYMLMVSVPDQLKADMGCDFLLLINVEGLSPEETNSTSNHELATVAAGLSDVLLLNISPHASSELEGNLALVVNALLCVKELGSMPFCQLLLQSEGIHSILQASQLKHALDVLQNKSANLPDDLCAQATSCATAVSGPWLNMFLADNTDLHYSRDVFGFKQKLFRALGKCAATAKAAGLPEFMGRLSAIWDAVRADSFSTGLQNRELALAFTSLCTEFSQWKRSFLEHVESWLSRTRNTMFATKANNVMHSSVVEEAEEEVKREAEKLRWKVETYFTDHDLLRSTVFKPVLLENVEHLQEQAVRDVKDRLMAANENHCSSTQLQTFETLLENETQSKLQAMIDSSKSSQGLVQDAQLEAEFEGVWTHVLANFDFRPSESKDISTRVKNVLRENLMSRGLQKHLKKLEAGGQNPTPDNQNQKFYIHDEHFGYRSRLKHMFEDNNRLQKLEAQQLASTIIQQYEQFVEDKSLLPAQFSDCYIKDLLENVERSLKDKAIEIKSAFEVDLKIFLCDAACQDFQKLHDRYAKDRELLQHISANKGVYLAEFMYQFRKTDQCRRTARAFTSMVLRPTVLNYVHRNLAMRIAEEVRGQAPRYRSRHAFHQSLLEELMGEDACENFLEYMRSFDDFRLRRLRETVAAYLSQSNHLITWRQQRLGEIVGMMAAAVSEAAEGTAGVLTDAKPLLERMCLTLELHGDVEVIGTASLDGPLFSITVKWDYFVTCLLELLAAMRLELAQEFTENTDVTHFLQKQPVQPHEYLLTRVEGCEMRCPLCGTPCEVEAKGHKVHGATVHRPIGMLPSQYKGPLESRSKGNADVRKDTDGASLACSHVDDPVWTPCTEGPDKQIASTYWRY